MFIDADTYTRLMGVALKKAREDAGLSIEQVAAKINISVLAIQNYEWRHNLPQMSYFLMLLEFYRLNFGQFHDMVVDIHSNELCEETSWHIADLEQRLSRLEGAAKSETVVR